MNRVSVAAATKRAMRYRFFGEPWGVGKRAAFERSSWVELSFSAKHALGNLTSTPTN